MAWVKSPFTYPFRYMVSGTTSRTLDAQDEYLFSMFRAPKTGTISKIGWRISGASSPVMKVRICLEKVATGVGTPVANTYAGKDLFSAGSESAELTSFTATTRFDAINGANGVAVTRGDLIAVTWRVVERTSGSIAIPMDGGGSIYGWNNSIAHETYAGFWDGATMVYLNHLNGTIVYSDGITVVSASTPAHDYSNATFNSSSNPDRRGMVFRFPDYKVNVSGFFVHFDCDSDTDIIFYAPDKYTVMATHTLLAQRRRSDALGFYYVHLPSDLTFEKNEWYRMVYLPKSGTNIQIYFCTPPTDGTSAGLLAFEEGLNVGYTTFNGTPTAQSCNWTDDFTRRGNMAVFVSEIDIPSGSGGGLITHPGMAGGMRG